MSRVCVVGAGKTGRGFLGRLIAESSDEIVFIDKNEALVNELNKRGEYTVHFFGQTKKDYTVSGFRAYTWENADISGCEFLMISAGGSNLKDVGKSLRNFLNGSETVITCENSSKPAEVLKKEIGIEGLRVSEAAVFCTTVEDPRDPLNIRSEDYPYLQCNAEQLNGFRPSVKGILPYENFGNFLTRKLYTYNAASCVIAYIGHMEGYTDYAAAANDCKILSMLDENYRQTNIVLCKVFGYDQKDQEEFALLSREKFTNPNIADTIVRNARDPLRKLADGERIIGPMKLIYENGALPTVLIKTCAAALLYREPSEEKWLSVLKEKGAEGVLEDICGLSKGSELFQAVMNEYTMSLTQELPRNNMSILNLTE